MLGFRKVEMGADYIFGNYMEKEGLGRWRLKARKVEGQTEQDWVREELLECWCWILEKWKWSRLEENYMEKEEGQKDEEEKLEKV